MKYKHIVFDIDGTLIDTEYAVLHSLQETIKGLSGREIPCSELRFALGITGTDALKKLEIKDTSYAIELWDKNMRNYTNTIKAVSYTHLQCRVIRNIVDWHLEQFTWRCDR